MPSACRVHPTERDKACAAVQACTTLGLKTIAHRTAADVCVFGTLGAALGERLHQGEI